MIAAPIAVKAAVLIAALVPPIVEAALRALLAAVAVWAGLRLLRVANVLVQKAAWGLVLIAALALPLLPHGRALPALAALRMPVFPLLSVPASQAAVPTATIPTVGVIAAAAPDEPAFALSEDAPLPASSRHAVFSAKRAARQTAVPPPDVDRIFAPTVTNSRFGSSEVEMPNRPESSPAPFTAQTVSVVKPTTAPAQPAPFRIATAAWILYFSVFAALLLRLLIGLVSAFRLWTSAEPVLAPQVADTVGNTPLRYSLRVASPINIGSGILLPADYAEWDEQKLRVVLAHERSHIRQGDFYLQLLAGLYASFFWFSPLGWWLKRKLSELGEAISDRAGLEEAASRSSYAQLLLEFAALPRPTLTGVAMARKSHLTQRIERLLNESSFRLAFAAGGRRTLLAFLLVPVALFAATAMVRVEAAASPQAQAASQPQTTGQSTPEQVTEPAPPAAPAPMPPPSGVMQAPPPPPPMDADGPAPGPGPMAPQSPMHVVVPPIHVDMPPMPPIHIQMPPDGVRVHIDPAMRAEIHAAREEARMYRNFNHGDHGDPYAIVGDPGSKNRIHGEWGGGRNEEIEKARKVAHGHFLWFRHDGKSYVVDDPTVVAQVEAMDKPMDEIGDQMRTLGDQMRAMGEKQRAEGQKLRDVAVPTPDLSKQLAELTAAAETLKAKQGGTISQKDLGEMQREIGRIQGDLGALQGKLMMQQMNLTGTMGQFGGQMGELGGKMGALGGKMGKIAQENREKIKGIIDDSLKNGKAKPIQ